MKNLLLLLVLLTTVNGVKAQDKLEAEDIKRETVQICLDELEMQHADDEDITASEYVEMENECRRLGD